METLFEILRDGDNVQDAIIIKLKNAHQKNRILHDLNSAIVALKMNIQIQKESLNEPNPREEKKFEQLNAHAARLQSLVEEISEIFHHSKTP